MAYPPSNRGSTNGANVRQALIDAGLLRPKAPSNGIVKLLPLPRPPSEPVFRTDAKGKRIGSQHVRWPVQPSEGEP